MNILFTLCGRAGSKGVKGKNARDFWIYLWYGIPWQGSICISIKWPKMMIV